MQYQILMATFTWIPLNLGLCPMTAIQLPSVFSFGGPTVERYLTCKYIKLGKATITRCDLSPRFFCIDATLLCEFESDKI